MIVAFTQAVLRHAVAVLRRDPLRLTDRQIDLLKEAGFGGTGRAARERAQLDLIAVQVQAAELIDNLTIERR